MAFAGQALVARLNDGTGVNANHGIISGVLVTVGDLTRVMGNITCFSRLSGYVLSLYALLYIALYWP
jgi:hypothetical protein